MHQPLYEISIFYRACIRCQVWFSTDNPNHDCCTPCRDQLRESDRERHAGPYRTYRDGIARRLIEEALS